MQNNNYTSCTMYELKIILKQISLSIWTFGPVVSGVMCTQEV